MTFVTQYKFATFYTTNKQTNKQTLTFPLYHPLSNNSVHSADK